ncbi:MAG: hypothetical protein JW795_11865 [Chitinivibrionales bacterium]|nr:hypothetical protein [Chitinivibrionales bacterium]
MHNRILFLEPEPYEIGTISKQFSGQYIMSFVSVESHLMEHIKEFRPEVLILDFEEITPSCEGLFGKIATLTATGLLPFIIITEKPTFSGEQLARQHAVFHYLIKPYQFRVLDEAIQAALSFASKYHSGIIGGGSP